VVGQPSVIGFMAVPLLFASLPSKALAGYAAAHLFAAQTWCRWPAVWCCCWFIGRKGLWPANGAKQLSVL
jgi:hypothetical protein